MILIFAAPLRKLANPSLTDLPRGSVYPLPRGLQLALRSALSSKLGTISHSSANFRAFHSYFGQKVTQFLVYFHKIICYKYFITIIIAY